VSVFTIPGIILNLSSVLFNGGVNKHEYPGGVLIIHGFIILLTEKFKLVFCIGEPSNCFTGCM